MIYFNVFLILLFFTLFILSSGVKLPGKKRNGSSLKRCFMRMAVFILKHFKVGNDTEVIKKQALLNPAGAGRQENEKYKAEKISEILIILFAGSMLSLIIGISSLFSGSDAENYFIVRKGYGEGDRRVDIDAKVDNRDIGGPIEVTVGERQYTTEETDRIFEKIADSLPERILGENSSLEKV